MSRGYLSRTAEQISSLCVVEKQSNQHKIVDPMPTPIIFRVVLSSQNVRWTWTCGSTNLGLITNDGRNIVGVLKGFDQATNIILDESHERVYSTKEGVQQHVLGLYIIRGDNISVVGELLDEELDAGLDFSASSFEASNSLVAGVT